MCGLDTFRHETEQGVWRSPTDAACLPSASHSARSGGSSSKSTICEFTLPLHKNTMAMQLGLTTLIVVCIVVAGEMSMPANALDRNLAGSPGVASVQPFASSSQASDVFVNEATSSPPAREANFENTDLSAADEQEIVGSLQPGSYSGDADRVVALSAATTSEEQNDNLDHDEDSSDNSHSLVLSAAAVAGVMCVGAAFAVYRQRQWQELQSPCTPPETSAYYDATKQIVPPRLAA